MAAPARKSVYAGQLGRSRRVADNAGQGTGGFGGRVTHGGTLYTLADRQWRGHERAEDAAYWEHDALFLAAGGVEHAERVAIPCELDVCSWCDEVTPVSELADVSESFPPVPIYVCEVCYPPEYPAELEE